MRPLADILDEVVQIALAHCDGSVSKAAAQLGIGRSTLYTRLGEAGLATSNSLGPATIDRPRQEETLRLLEEPRSAAELRSALGVSRQAVHKLLGKLVRDGRVRRTVPEGRKRPLFSKI